MPLAGQRSRPLLGSDRRRRGLISAAGSSSCPRAENRRGNAMPAKKLSRRDVLIGAAARAAVAAETRGIAAAPPAGASTPELVAVAQHDGKRDSYTSVGLPLAAKLTRAFEAKYPGVACRVERAGAERVFQRIGQEYGSRIYAVDVVNSSDAAHFIVWKRDGLLAPFVPEDVARHYPAEHKDPDGTFASFRVSFSAVGYNTGLVKPEAAPRSFADLLDAKWTGKIVKAHPAYSGTIMTATFQLVRELGWGYFEKLAKQKVMQVQSATDPPKKLALGERAVMADGGEYNLIQLKEAGQPVELVYPSEGIPTVVGPNAIFRNAPNPNAARLFQCYCFSAPCQQLISDVGGMRSMHPQV